MITSTATLTPKPARADPLLLAFRQWRG